MKSVHLTPELLDAVVRLELPPEVLVRLVWDHLPEVCPECGEAVEEWQNRTQVRLRDYDDAFRSVIARAKDDEETMSAEERYARRELAELLRTEPEDRLGKVERATKRFSTPYLAHLLIEEAYALRHDDPAEVLGLAKVAHAVAKRSDVGEVLVRAAAHLGNAYRINALLLDAHRVFTETRRYLRAYHVVDPLLFAEVDRLEGSLRRDRGEVELAAKLLRRSQLVYQVRREDKKAAQVLHKLGALYLKKGRHEDALEAFHRERDLLGESPDDVALAMVHQGLIAVYVDANEPHEARRLLEKTRESLANLPGKTSALRVTWIEGRIARGLEELDSAAALFKEAIRGFAKLGIGYDAALVALDLAETYLAQGDRDRVLRLSGDLTQVLAANDLTQEAIAAIGLFQNAAEQGLLTGFLLEQIKGRLREVGGK